MTIFRKRGKSKAALSKRLAAKLSPRAYRQAVPLSGNQGAAFDAPPPPRQSSSGGSFSSRYGQLRATILRILSKR
jgi:hypothetical protein